MIDLHSHVLPAVDDGCQTVEESLAVLDRLRLQGVTTMVATPHFHPSVESVDEFLARRRLAREELAQAGSVEGATIRLGAEVRYYPGISRMDGLDKLKIEGTPLLLLEMPLGRWTEYVLRDLLELAGTMSGQLVLAHIERYWKDQPKKSWQRLLEAGILMQVNAPFFADARTRRLACKLLKNHSIHFLGSDSHNLTERAPRLDEAAAVIRKRLGEDFADQWFAYGEDWFA